MQLYFVQDTTSIVLGLLARQWKLALINMPTRVQFISVDKCQRAHNLVALQFDNNKINISFHSHDKDQFTISEHKNGMKHNPWKIKTLSTHAFIIQLVVYSY